MFAVVNRHADYMLMHSAVHTFNVYYLANFLWPICDPASRIDLSDRHLPPRQVAAPVA
jgi:hypothetical protein